MYDESDDLDQDVFRGEFESTYGGYSKEDFGIDVIYDRGIPYGPYPPPLHPFPQRF